LRCCKKLWFCFVFYSTCITFVDENERRDMYKNLFSTAILLIFKPLDAWKKLNSKQTDDQESFLSGYVYPFIGLITLTAFIGVLFTRKQFDFQIALKESILVLLSVFGGFFLASYLFNEMWHTLFHRERDMKLCQRFVGYASSLMYCLYIVLSLFPEFFFLRFFLLYTFYMVWEGAIPFMEVKESEQLKFVGFATLIIILTPLAIEFILGLMMPGLRI